MSGLVYVNKKSELTEYLLYYSELGQTVYRTRMNCGCCHADTRRYGLLVIDTATDKVERRIIRCRGCAAKDGAQ